MLGSEAGDFDPVSAVIGVFFGVIGVAVTPTIFHWLSGYRVRATIAFMTLIRQGQQGWPIPLPQSDLLAMNPHLVGTTMEVVHTTIVNSRRSTISIMGMSFEIVPPLSARILRLLRRKKAVTGPWKPGMPIEGPLFPIRLSGHDEQTVTYDRVHLNSLANLWCHTLWEKPGKNARCSFPCWKQKSAQTACGFPEISRSRGLAVRD